MGEPRVAKHLSSCRTDPSLGGKLKSRQLSPRGCVNNWDKRSNDKLK